MGKRTKAQNFRGIHSVGARVNGKVGLEHRPLSSQSCVLPRMGIKEKLSLGSAWKEDVQSAT